MSQKGNGTCSTDSVKDSDQCKAFEKDLRSQTDATARIDNIEEKIVES